MDYGEIYLKSPAKKWDHGLPIGNGRLGAMVMGKINEETIFLNEETLVYGPNRKRENPYGYENLEKIRELLVNGHIDKAAFLAKMALTSTPKYNNPYQPLGDLRLCFQGDFKMAENYSRKLDLGNAIATVSYEVNGVLYEREHFVSEKYQVLAIRVKVIGDGMVTMCANINRKPFEEFTGLLDDKTCGCWGENGVDGIHYLTAARIASGKGKSLGDFIYAENQNEIVLFLAAQTDYEACLNHSRYMGQEAYDQLYHGVDERLSRAVEVGYDMLKKEHIEDYRELFDNFELSIGKKEQSPNGIPTNELLDTYREGNREKEGYLTGLMVQYARYLMISSSKNCLLPANLQGIWNGSYEPPWQSQFTININTQMNYWFVEKAGLSQCHLPLFRLIKLLEKNGKDTAWKLYRSRGFCAHHNTNVWGATAPEGIFDASPYWVMGGAWLSLHLFEHYSYTEDRDFLEHEAMPIMREAIRFFEDYLFQMPDGSLVTGPVVSPENTYRSWKGEKGALCMGTAMDNSILRQLIEVYLEGMEILDWQNEKDKTILKGMQEKLQPLTIGKDGRIMEWMEEYEEVEPGHRHISHLYGLHPGHEIVPENPGYFSGAKKTLEYRLEHGGGHTGWSRAWLACFAARLRDGTAFLEHVEELFRNCIQDNLLDVHPPFQIDGNFGIAEAVLEALIQEREEKLILLPALPGRWDSGVLKGYCLRGGARLSMEWREGKIIMLALQSPKEREYVICYKEKEKKVHCLENMEMKVI